MHTRFAIRDEIAPVRGDDRHVLKGALITKQQVAVVEQVERLVGRVRKPPGATSPVTGGELAAAVITDSVIRLLPGAISDETSALSDSFQDGLLAPPVYTRPAEYKGWRVPDILLSGHAAKIADWKHEQSLERTRLLRPDLLDDTTE